MTTQETLPADSTVEEAERSQALEDLQAAFGKRHSAHDLVLHNDGTTRGQPRTAASITSMEGLGTKALPRVKVSSSTPEDSRRKRRRRVSSSSEDSSNNEDAETGHWKIQEQIIV
ncbi:hypothetical protein Tco_0300528 [Tanacetum coccineum]